MKPPHPGRKGKDRVLLGLAVSALSLQEGQCRTNAEIAAFCDCHPWNIGKIYNQAIAKLRKSLDLMPDGSDRSDIFYSTTIERKHSKCSKQ